MSSVSVSHLELPESFFDFTLLKVLNRTLKSSLVVILTDNILESNRESLHIDMVLFAHVVRNITKVAYASREVPISYICVQIFNLTTLTCVNEVTEVITTAGELLNYIHIFIVGDAMPIPLLHNISFGAIEHDTDLVAARTLKQLIQFLIC